MPTTTTATTTRRARAGFTLIEIMVVIAIIGLLLTVVAPNVWNKLRQAKVTTTKMKMNNVKNAVGDYRNDYSKVPDTLEQLLEPSEKNVGEAYLEKQDQLLDAWENPFRYTKISNSKFDIVSLGADGMEGGENDDRDLSINDDAMPANAK
jgi:general secretion pathway protein G